MRPFPFVFSGLALLAIAAGAAIFVSAGHRTSEAAQSPTLSLDMAPSGNAYDESTNTITVGTIDNCLTSTAPNPSTHLHTVQIVIQNVQDLEGWQARINYIGDRLRPNTINFSPFTDNSTGQNVSFSNLPIDSITGIHRDVTGGISIPPAPPDGSNTAQSALVGSSYVGERTLEVSPDTPQKTVSDGGSYQASTGGVVASMSVQVVGDESGQASLGLDLDDGDPNPPGSVAIVFTDSGSLPLNLSQGALGDGFHGEGTPCVALGLTDPDGDGVPSDRDLCPRSPNKIVDEVGCSFSDVDPDLDSICNPDAPSDGPYNCTGSDNCPDSWNRDQSDTNSNGIGDVCDPDADSDGVPKTVEQKFGSSDTNASSQPEALEYDAVTCSDGVDNDLDGSVDAADSLCPPANDNFADAREIGPLPYTDEASLSVASLEQGEPTSCSSGRTHTVWYRFSTVRDTGIIVIPDGYPPSTVGVFTGQSLSTLSPAGCSTGIYTPYVVSIKQGQTVFLQFADTPDNGYGRLSLTVFSDLDSDGVEDGHDNCPAIPNAQSDSDSDGIGDACDPTPTHDLKIVEAFATTPVIDRGTGTLNWWIRVQNSKPFRDEVAVYSYLFVPAGCHVVSTRGETPGVVGAMRTEKLNFHTRINCEATVRPGSYSYQLNILVQPYPGSSPQIFRILTGSIQLK